MTSTWENLAWLPFCCPQGAAGRNPIRTLGRLRSFLLVGVLIGLASKGPRVQPLLPLAPYSQLWKLWETEAPNTRILRQFWEVPGCGFQLFPTWSWSWWDNGSKAAIAKLQILEQMAEVSGEVILTHPCLLSQFLGFFFLAVPCGILVPWPGIEPHPLHWKPGVLTTGLPGNSLY